MTIHNERVRHYSLLAYVIMLALLVPLTVFLAKQEQIVQTRAYLKTTISITPSIAPSASAQP